VVRVARYLKVGKLISYRFSFFNSTSMISFAKQRI